MQAPETQHLSTPTTKDKLAIIIGFLRDAEEQFDDLSLDYGVQIAKECITEVLKLEEHLTFLSSLCSGQAVDIATREIEVRELRIVRNRMQEALRKYGGHRDKRKGAESVCWPICQCGFANALEPQDV